MPWVCSASGMAPIWRISSRASQLFQFSTILLPERRSMLIPRLQLALTKDFLLQTPRDPLVLFRGHVRAPSRFSNYIRQSALPGVRLEEGLATFYHLVDRALPPACSSRLGESRDYGGAVLVTAELPDLSASKGERMDPIGLDCLTRALDIQGVVP